MGRLTLYHRYPMKKSRTIQLTMGLYEILWRVGTPLLKHHPRLREGFAHRAAADHLSGADIWIHAASAGEAFLSLSLIDGLQKDILSRILVTTNTRQGLDIIQNGVAQVSGNRPVSVMADYMPFDRPRLMEQAVSKVSPKAMILLETELWPGLLMALKKNSIPSLLVNGRLTPKSLKQYILWPELWSTLGPDHVLAISEEDAARFSTLFGCETVRTMKNIKFDRLNTAPHPATGHLKSLIPENHPFLVLGSVRREEEKPVEAIIRLVLSELPETVIGLFPRHMERIDHWTERIGPAGRSLAASVLPGPFARVSRHGCFMGCVRRAESRLCTGPGRLCGREPGAPWGAEFSGTHDLWVNTGHRPVLGKFRLGGR